eukprot:844040_1
MSSLLVFSIFVFFFCAVTDGQLQATPLSSSGWVDDFTNDPSGIFGWTNSIHSSGIFEYHGSYTAPHVFTLSRYFQCPTYGDLAIEFAIGFDCDCNTTRYNDHIALQINDITLAMYSTDDATNGFNDISQNQCAGNWNRGDQVKHTIVHGNTPFKISWLLRPINEAGGRCQMLVWNIRLTCSQIPTAQPTKAPITDSPTSTDAPTTGAPTTPAPTTEAPTTDAPTTNAPTTDSPTTGAPTTHSPTTDAPTTASPTTDAPTTHSPTTPLPTTGSPTTGAPTTDSPLPTTGSPTTGAPTTDSPTRMDPTTAQPTTHALTTHAPTTHEPTTRAPTTVSPTTDASTTYSPTTAMPTRDSPTTAASTTYSP